MILRKYKKAISYGKKMIGKNYKLEYKRMENVW